jgi:hypothetical protein
MSSVVIPTNAMENKFEDGFKFTPPPPSLHPIYQQGQQPLAISLVLPPFWTQNGHDIVNPSKVFPAAVSDLEHQVHPSPEGFIVWIQTSSPPPRRNFYSYIKMALCSGPTAHGPLCFI